MNARSRASSAVLTQFVRYFFAGGAAALVEWTTFWICNSVLSMFYLAAVAVAFLIATMVNYVLSSRFVFGRSRRKQSVEVVLVYLVSAAGLGLNFLLMWILHGRLQINAMLAKIVSTGVVFLWNYTARRWFVFGSTPP